jgi:hypothetical protein
MRNSDWRSLAISYGGECLLPRFTWGDSMGTEEYTSRLGLWLQETENLKIEDSVCSWTDLLGFGALFTDSSWSPTKEQWATAINRVSRAYKQFCASLSPTNELTLALNDGIVRVKHPNDHVSRDLAKLFPQ